MHDPRAPEAAPSAPDALAGVVRGLHHVAIVVPSIAEARRTWEGALGLSVAERGGARARGAGSAHPDGADGVEHVADQRVNVLVLFAGSQRVELVEPAGPDSPVHKFLAKTGGGLHHLAWRVDDVAAALTSLAAAGVRLIDAAPRPGAHGTRIAFVHPKSTGGVLMELVEDPSHG
ncbi:MAG: methylmalonyl-CoA epimerase [Planctomycetota bacterium]